jgi:primosomal protein N''
MARVIQIKINREEILEAVRKYIERKVAESCRKQRINEQIAEEVEQATIEVTVPEYEVRLKALEEAMSKVLEGKNG